MGFNLSDYQPVEERNAQFWAKYPAGRILTELVFDDGQRFTFRCEVFRDADDTRPAATGYATETVSNSGVNRTSALENAETSAEGRALARAGFAPKGARPSREEMQKADRGQQQAPPRQRTAEQPAQESNPAADKARADLRDKAEKAGMSLQVLADAYEKQYGETLKLATSAARITAFTKLQNFSTASRVNGGAPAEAGTRT